MRLDPSRKIYRQRTALVSSARGAVPSRAADVERGPVRRNEGASARPRAAARAAVPEMIRPRAEPAPLQLVEVPGAVAPILLPRTTPLSRWACAVRAEAVFPDQKDVLDRLCRAVPTARDFDGAGDARPCVGIVVNEPHDLFPRPKNDVAILVARAREMGLEPVLIPPCADAAAPKARASVIAGLLAPLDGLFGPGGADIDPRIYHAKNRYSVNTNYIRDLFEKALVLAAMDHPLFMFGICRSHQLWNVAAGGDLVQDMEKEGLASMSHRRRPRGRAFADHPVRFLAGSRARALSRREVMSTNTLHHQAVRKPGRGLVATGFVHDPKTRADIIEATESWNVMTTQFHPELMANGTAGRALLSVMCRRAQIFHMMKRLGDEADGPRLLEAMESHGGFTDADYAWVKDELAPRLLAQSAA